MTLNCQLCNDRATWVWVQDDKSIMLICKSCMLKLAAAQEIKKEVVS